jgi:hypothetical protein
MRAAHGRHGDGRGDLEAAHVAVRFDGRFETSRVQPQADIVGGREALDMRHAFEDERARALQSHDRAVREIERRGPVLAGFDDGAGREALTHRQRRVRVAHLSRGVRDRGRIVAHAQPRVGQAQDRAARDAARVGNVVEPLDVRPALGLEQQTATDADEGIARHGGVGERGGRGGVACGGRGARVRHADGEREGERAGEPTAAARTESAVVPPGAAERCSRLQEGFERLASSR